jgi:hypothetical protein
MAFIRRRHLRFAHALTDGSTNRNLCALTSGPYDYGDRIVFVES